MRVANGRSARSGIAAEAGGGAARGGGKGDRGDDGGGRGGASRCAVSADGGGVVSDGGGSRLEDLAGNSVARPFNVDLEKGAVEEGEGVEVGFVVRE